MGRRSALSTKCGKFRNPSDQARKEDRKRELRKNKKQRMMARVAALKMKDPKQIIWDMEKLDEMQFNPLQQPQLNENVLKAKRRKLHETFQSIVRLYGKENPDMAQELGKLEVQCEQKRAQLNQYLEAVKKAQQVELESIPLPDMPYAPSNILVQHMPLPGAQSPTVLKNLSSYGPLAREISFLPSPGHSVPPLPPGRIPPGPPPGPPPIQVLQMYGHKVGFALDLVPPQQEEDGLHSTELAQGAHDGAAAAAFSTIEEDCSQAMDQEQHDDSSHNRDTDKADDLWKGKEFMHGDEERGNSKDKDSALTVRLAGVPGKSGKKKQIEKQLTPLQATMLRLAGQEIPEEEQEAGVFSEDDEQDSEDSEDTGQQQHKEGSLPDGASSSPASQPQELPPQSILPAQSQLPAMPGLHPAPPLGPGTGALPGLTRGAAPLLRPLGMPGFRGPSSRLLLAGPSPQGPQQSLWPPAPLAIPPPPPGRKNLPFVPQCGPAPPGLFLSAPLMNPQIGSGPSNLMQRPKRHDTTAAVMEKKITAIISAKPQITNPKAAVIRFVPTALRVHRENKGAAAAAPQRKSGKDLAVPLAKTVPQSGPSAPVSVQTKDEVYKAFMKEMEGLL